MKKLLTALALGLVMSGVAYDPSHAGEGFFEKIGDGWRKGTWVPGIPDVKPQTLQEVIFPVCWGSPQDCRDDAKKNNTSRAAGQQVATVVSVTYMVDCIDATDGADRADSVVTVSASTRQAAVAEIERLKQTTDLCQGNGDLSRVTKRGTGRYLN
ncbi:MAG: hypothetical protein QOJ15_10678 [Bradyrhizobium sp.]|jgi:hypothetical protein|nr:hypothetical protein [Bradyrhizobium sp.]